MGEVQKLKGKEKFAYGIGAVGKDMVYMLSASYVLYYYQDIMGVSAVAMGVILFIARIFDAFNDPIMGIIVAKTKTRWGKFRPWLFIGTLTNAIVLYLMFAAPPSLSGRGLVAYAASIVIQIFQIKKDETAEVLTVIAPASRLGLRMCMTIIPILVLLIGLLVFRKHYILTDEKTEEISRTLEERKRA